MNTIANIYSARTLLAALIISLLPSSLFAQPLSPSDKPVVVESEEGMIVIGEIEKTDENAASLKTTYGLLTIPWQKIFRVDGDAFNAQQGIVREHSVVLRRDGSVLLEYLQPVSASYTNRTVNLLALGAIVNIADLNGEPLVYMARAVDDFTRCTITMPEYRLPAVRIQVLQPAAAALQDNRLTYTYSYTPRIEQTFRFRMEIPAGAVVRETTPQPAEQSASIILWQETLRRQQTTEFKAIIELQ